MRSVYCMRNYLNYNKKALKSLWFFIKNKQKTQKWTEILKMGIAFVEKVCYNYFVIE